jgi:phosphohistidine phosphatase
MQLILVRHAEAQGQASEDPELDFKRSLTATGREQARQLTEALRLQGVRPGIVASSPLVRARETAVYLQELLPNGRAVTELEDLRLDRVKPRRLSKAVIDLNDEHIILVGHMPDLGIYAAWLLGSGCGVVKFKKAAAASFLVPDEELQEGCGELQWFVTPSWCQTASRATSL